VLDRFSNPNIEHHWKSIAMNYTEKIKMRNLFLIDKYTSLTDTVPVGMSICIAAFFVYQQKINQAISDNEFSYDVKFKKSVNKFITLINQNGVMWAINEYINKKL
jgi:tagaturonate reductase